MPNKQRFSTQTRSLEEDTISGIIERYNDDRNINLIKSINNCMASTFFFKQVWKPAEEKDVPKILNKIRISLQFVRRKISMLKFLLWKSLMT